METGAFSVESCFAALRKLTNLELRMNLTDNIDFSWIWKMHLPPKLKQFLWLLNHGRLPTSCFLHSINILQSLLCMLCDLREEETCVHLFLLCPKLAPLWSELGITPQIASLGYVKWNPHANSNIMLITDSGCDSVSGLSTLGGVFRNSVGDWILGFTGTCPTSQPLEMEMRALLLRLTLALQYGMICIWK
ncbi:hypothetical protein MTR67_003740 [Solanum verrucosum]|uniref:Reverse transcriptase zinc-binding domain-containing protein n=1 Tax=Solanum verrucosum TaxID=315347 RepID=A0AAF0PUW3_SOLVR|nr:hypothetical protein MTR67_003740 [Solanum verrucosum]